MKKVAVLGSTGSVGRQTLEVIRAHADELSACALSCHTNTRLMQEQARQFGVKTLVSTQNIECEGTVYSGEDALVRYAAEGDYDILVVAVGGLSGLKPTLAALHRDKIVCLANKESLVCGGRFVMDAVISSNGVLLPVDSEHSAVWQSLEGNRYRDIKRIILTASGGALRDYPLDKLPLATPREVLAHPNWAMGDKITVDCATMVNKAFEVVEAHYLFDVPYEDIDVLVHRESVVHSMVELRDNSVKAQLGVPDMRLPIQYALLYPARRPSLVGALDLVGRSLTFEGLDEARYPAFRCVVDGAAQSTSKAVAAVAADEAAVKAFLDGHIPLGGIHTILQRAVDAFDGNVRDLADVWRIYAEAAQTAKEGLC